MRFPFSQVPLDPADIGRPLLNLAVEGVSVPVTCLLDTGAVHNRLPTDWAIAAGIDLGNRPTDLIGLGGQASVRCHLVEDVQVTIVGVSLNLSMWFCDDWHPPFGLLGQEGFLQYFTLTLSAQEECFELEES